MTTKLQQSPKPTSSRGPEEKLCPYFLLLLVEQYQPQRDAETWNQCLQQKLGPLPVTVCQVVSDEAKALLRQAETLLGVHHSPDLFHVQHDVVQATSLALAGQTERAAVAVKHHALHQFTTRKLQALTVLHNYVMRRADGTTAAERFYGAAPRDCFAWLLDRVAVPARPRAGRRHA